MKVEQIKCSGYGFSAPVKPSQPLLLTSIKLFRMRFSPEDIMAKIDAIQADDYYFGTRCRDDDSVYRRIASAITSAAIKEIYPEFQNKVMENEQVLVLEGFISAFTESLSGSEMDALIIDGFRDCASADHWYKFEKQWD
jgi:hypothetical protein